MVYRTIASLASCEYYFILWLYVDACLLTTAILAVFSKMNPGVWRAWHGREESMRFGLGGVG
jgi:hypothetical protein